MPDLLGERVSGSRVADRDGLEVGEVGDRAEDPDEPDARPAFNSGIASTRFCRKAMTADIQAPIITRAMPVPYAFNTDADRAETVPSPRRPPAAV
jgi:hypothetical protein